MNARIMKETRSVLPVFGVTVLACVAPRLIWSRETATGVGLMIFTICCLIMGASCFGNEFQWRTMPLLLAQPVPRRKIWNEKMLVLGSALGLGLILFLVCEPVQDKDAILFLILVPFGVFCAAPYLALKMKNTLMAAVCTFGLPFGLCGTVALLTWLLSPFFPPLFARFIHPELIRLGSFLRQHSLAAWHLLGDVLDKLGNHPDFWICVGAAIYCVICYRLGFRAFMKLEAVDSQTRELALPPRMEALLAHPLSRLLPGYSGPWASLIRKELQLQKPAFLVAGALLVASPLIALAWDFDHSDLFEALASAAIALLVFVIPLITAGTCVAEERSWGVSEWQRALPVTARRQWAAKMLTVMFVTLLLGIVVPLLLWICDGWVFQLPNGARLLHFGAPATTGDLMMVPCWVLGYIFVLGLGVFTSSTCANSTKAIITNMGLIIFSGGIAGGIVASVAGPMQAHYTYVFQLQHPPPPPSTIGLEALRPFLVPMTLPSGQHVLGFPAPSPMGFATDHPLAVLIALGVLLSILLVLVQCVACSNYRNGEPSSRRVWGQLAVVAGAIAAAALTYWGLLGWNMIATLFWNP